MSPATLRHRLVPLLLVGLGGFGGASLRHLVSLGLPATFPVGTLVVNVLGSFALGLLLYDARLLGSVGAETRLAVGTGFLSSFTTYSTFAFETASLSPGAATMNVAMNYALGVAAVLIARAVVGWRAA